ncbi:MAG: TonB-dependent receptor [Burkholderiales bacterium]
MTPRLSSCLILLPLTFAAVPGYSADATQPAAADAGGTALEQVVVTSQKRAQDVQDVPVSISVLSHDQLQSQHIANFDDLSRSVPGVAFNAVSASEGETNVTIRGVSSTAGSATVSLYLDDVSITTKNFWDFASQPRFSDLQSIEVLRGPQGTLWGDSSEGGTIRFIPVEPNMKNFSGEVSADVSETRHGSFNDSGSVVLNVPVNPGIFAVRASLSSSFDNGWIDNYTQQGSLANAGVNSDSATTFHIMGKITPNDDLTIKPAFFRQINNAKDNNAFYLNNPNANSGGVGSTFTPGLYMQDKQVREFSQDLMSLGSLSIHNDFHTFEFTSVTGVFHRSDNRQEDGTFYNSTLFAQLFLDPAFPQYQSQNDSIIGNLPSPVEMKTDYRQVSQEFRISSPENSKDPLKWVTGLYYEDQVIHNTDFQRIPGINTAFQGIYGFSLDSPQSDAAVIGIPGTTLFPGDIDEADDRTYREKQVALFGQLDYDLRPDWHAGLGGRFIKASEDFVSAENGFYQNGNLGFSQPGDINPPFTQSQTFTKFTPKVTLSHDIDSNNQLYASVGEGFRLGGPTGPIPATSCTATGDFAQNGITTPPTSFKSDSLWTYELGSKNILADNRFSLNTAIFYTSWKNVQQQVDLTGCGFVFIENVGNAEIFGGEVEAAAKVTRALKVSMTVSRESATITSTNNPLAAPVGAHLIDVPNLTATLGASYTAAMENGSKLVTRANYAWTGHSNGSLQPLLPTSGLPNPAFNNNGYGVLNLSASLTSKSYDLTLYAKNALNNQTIIQSPSINTVTEGYTVRPLTVGMTSTFRF